MGPMLAPWNLLSGTFGGLEYLYVKVVSRIGNSCVTPNLMVSGIYQVLRQDVQSNIESGSRGPLWIDFNLCMDRSSHVRLSLGLNYLSKPKYNGCTVEAWKWIWCNCLPHLPIDIITYPCQNYPLIKAKTHGYVVSTVITDATASGNQ